MDIDDSYSRLEMKIVYWLIDSIKAWGLLPSDSFSQLIKGVQSECMSSHTKLPSQSDSYFALLPLLKDEFKIYIIWNGVWRWGPEVNFLNYVRTWQTPQKKKRELVRKR